MPLLPFSSLLLPSNVATTANTFFLSQHEGFFIFMDLVFSNDVHAFVTNTFSMWPKALSTSHAGAVSPHLRARVCSSVSSLWTSTMSHRCSVFVFCGIFSVLSEGFFLYFFLYFSGYAICRWMLLWMILFFVCIFFLFFWICDVIIVVDSIFHFLIVCAGGMYYFSGKIVVRGSDFL